MTNLILLHCKQFDTKGERVVTVGAYEDISLKNVDIDYKPQEKKMKEKGYYHNYTISVYESVKEKSS